MSEDNEIKIEPGIALYLTSGVFYWSVGDPGDPDYMSGSSETLEGARKARSQYTATLAKKDRPKIEIPVLDTDEGEYTLTGIHAGHGKVLTKPPNKRTSYAAKRFYATREACKVLAKIRELEAVARSLMKALSNSVFFCADPTTQYQNYSKPTDEEITRELTRLTAEWGQAESQQRRIDAGLAKGLALPTLVWESESEEPDGQ